jgi:ubiquinone/menaquinone biosynthesis C-methylase UbiE
MNEIQFQKYKTKGPGYHWEQISRSIKKRNVYVVARYELILDLIGDKIKGRKVLDVGCGDGVLSYLLAKKGAVVTGIDTSEEAIKFAKEKCKNLRNINFIVGSAYNLPFEDKSFDYIVSSEVIEHLKYPEKMLLEIKRVWNQNGKIIITTPIKFTEKPLDEMHYQEFFEDEFKKLLEKYFEDVEVKKSHPLFWMEFQNKVIFGHAFNKFFLNLINLLFGFNPFLDHKGWRYYTLQTAIISK